jgi:hypothetical protein
MKFVPIAFAAAATLSLGFVVSDARATYSGYTYRKICPADAIVPTNQNSGYGDYWALTNMCGVTPLSSLPSGQFTFATVAVPWEATSSQVANVSAGVHGTGSGHGSVITLDAYAYDQDGNFMWNPGNPWSSGTTINQQVIAEDISVPANGSLVVNVAAQGQATLDVLQVGWEANGL